MVAQSVGQSVGQSVEQLAFATVEMKELLLVATKAAWKVEMLEGM